MHEKTPVAIFLGCVILAALFLAGMYVLPWSNVKWGILQTLPAKTITVTGEAKNEQQNQLATYSAGVNAINDNKQAAVDEVNSKMDTIVKALVAFGIKSTDIKTQNMNIYQNEVSYYEEGVQKSKPGQWRVGNTIEVKLRDVERASALTDILSKSGATNVYGPNYTSDDTSDAANALMGTAFKNAQDKATMLAKTSGRTLGQVVSVTENYSSSPVYYGGGGMGGGGGDKPGTTTVTKTVTVTFELR